MTLQTELGTTMVLIHDGKGQGAPGASAEAEIKLPQSTLAQLVAGYRSARDILNDSQVCAHGEMAPLLDVLFPQCQPYMWVADHF
ncbi:MAG: sterol carrier protein domain-containing protein [Chloroflexi bacterium]|nr:sterol carrier protein domain-containing protein [Chloroflexota bacterium]